MAVDIGPKIGIDGERQFRQELAQINQALKVLDSEAKSVANQMEREVDAEKKSAAQKDVLNRKIETQREKLKKLEEGLEASARKYGEADTKTMKWQQAVYDATAALAKMENELSDSDNKVDEVSDSLDNAYQATSGWADVMKGSLLADAVKAGLSFIKDTVSGIASATLDASKAGAAYADDILTMATVTGLSTDTLQEYKYMVGLADVELNTITGSLSKMTKNMNSAKKGTGDIAEAWESLGVNILNADGSMRTAQDVFNETLEALSKIDNETERDAKAMTIFGKSAQELKPLMDLGAEGLADFAEEARKSGYVLSGSALTALGKQQDAMDRLGVKTEALSNKFAVRLAPSMERAYSKIGETLENPRVQRGLDVISEGISGIIDGAVDLASRVLPDLFNVFTLGDDRLKYLTDEQLKIVQSVDQTREAHGEMVNGFKDNAKGIVDETERIQGLWQELQNLAGENGEVKKADEERVNYIITTLNDALGTQLGLEDGLLQNYKDQQTEIDNLIKKREAEALIAAGADAFADAEAKRNEALENAAKLAPQVDAAYRDMARAQQDYAKALEYANKKWSDPADEEKRLRFMNEYVGAVNDAKANYQLLADEYAEAQSVAQSYYSDVDKWQRAQTAAANGNYKEVVRILTSEFSVTLDYYKDKKKLNDQEKKDLKDKIADAELTIAEYKRNLKKGLAGFSEAGLKEMEDYVAEAKQILDGKVVAGYFINGMIAGLEDPAANKRLAQAAAKAAKTVDQNARKTLEIKSPSKKAKYIGQMWDEGLIVGLESGESAVGRTSSSVADSLIGGASGIAPSVGSYAGGTTLLSQGGSTTNSYSTTNMGGITVKVDGSGAMNEDVLAQRVAVQLTRQLQRAQRAR